MSNNTNTIHPVKDISREEKMDQLLNQMAETFQKAFPTTKDLVGWIAFSNLLTSEDKNAEDAKVSFQMVFDLGANLLENLMEARTDREKTEATKNFFAEQRYDYARAIPFLVYKHIHLAFDSTDDQEYFTKIISHANQLLDIAICSKEYALLRNEKIEEKAA